MFKLVPALVLGAFLALGSGAAAVPLIGPSVPTSDFDFEAGGGSWTLTAAHILAVGGGFPPAFGNTVANDTPGAWSFSHAVGAYGAVLVSIDFAFGSTGAGTLLTVFMPNGSNSGAVALRNLSLTVQNVSTILGAPITFFSPGSAGGSVLFSFSNGGPTVGGNTMIADNVLVDAAAAGVPEMDPSKGQAPIAFLGAIALLICTQRRQSRATV